MDRHPHSTLGDALLGEARSVIHQRLHPSATLAPPPQMAELAAPGACFVTLTAGEKLRGCIGTLEASRPLIEDVHANALAAAFGDPRFPPLRIREWPDVVLEVSLLGPIERQSVPALDLARNLIGAARTGVLIEAAGRRATFLPQVWESLPDPADFLAALLAKAGLRDWPADAILGRYAVQAFAEGTSP